MPKSMAKKLIEYAPEKPASLSILHRVSIYNKRESFQMQEIGLKTGFWLKRVVIRG
jgi:hypothetical protein